MTNGEPTSSGPPVKLVAPTPMVYVSAAVLTPLMAPRASPPGVVICCCVPAPASGYTWVTYTFCVEQARGIVVAALLVHLSRTRAAPVVAEAGDAELAVK